MTPAHKNTEHPPGQIVNPIGVANPVRQMKDLASEISDFHLAVSSKPEWPLLGSEDIITITRSELLILLVKLDQPDSGKALIRKSEIGNKKYRIQAIEDISPKDIYRLHTRDVKEVLRISKILRGDT